MERKIERRKPFGGKKMRYEQIKEDLQAIDSLLAAGRIGIEEAHEMRAYLEGLAG
jgi:hypothetical protein